jgi:hypothetical protein
MRATLPLGALFMIFSTLIWPARPATAQAPPQTGRAASGEPLGVALCQLLADPAAYNHQLVRVTGNVRHGLEGVFRLEDPACKDGANNGKGPRGAHLEMGGTVDRVETQIEDSELQKFKTRLVEDIELEKFNSLLMHRGPDILWVTLVCRYFSGTPHTWPNGTTSWELRSGDDVVVSSAGPLRPLLVIQQVVAVERAPALH